uniref:Cyclin-dependent kinase F-1 n=1 Tax=Anthurium amnicola TaxID=1678845 RepID=A0A1D1YLF6_9ARAE
MEEPPPPPAPARSWSIYGRSEITQRYEILERVGSGAYSDVYRGRRLSDGLAVALKEIHDYQSAFREIEALQILRHAPNVVALLEYFWQEDEDAVLVLEFLRTDLASVIREGKRDGGIPVGEVKQWMVQILRGVEACHGSGVVHRDLKPSNLLISAEGVLKLADFGQSRILQEPRFVSQDDNTQEQGAGMWSLQEPEIVTAADNSGKGEPQNQAGTEMRPIYEEDYLREVDGLKARYPVDETGREINIHDVDASCVATCSTSDVEDDPLKGSYLYEVDEDGDMVDTSGALTSCVGTRWFRAPELLYGSTSYGEEIDLWSLGCIFAELLTLEPLFPGTSDIDQLGKIINVLGDLTEETWPGCSNLPDYGKIFFGKVEKLTGLEACLPNRSISEVNIVKRLLCYNPISRATATELLQDSYFSEEPLPVPPSELRVPSTSIGQDESSTGGWCDYKNLGSDSDMEDFSGMDVSTTDKGFSIRFS